MPRAALGEVQAVCVCVRKRFFNRRLSGPGTGSAEQLSGVQKAGEQSSQRL